MIPKNKALAHYVDRSVVFYAVVLWCDALIAAAFAFLSAIRLARVALKEK